MEAKNFSAAETLTNEEMQERTRQVYRRFNNLIWTQGADGKAQIDAIMLPNEQVTETLMDSTPGRCKVNASPWVPASRTEDGGLINMGLVTYRDQVIETVEIDGKAIRTETNLDRPPIPAVYHQVFNASGELVGRQESLRVVPGHGVILKGAPISNEAAQWEQVDAVLTVFEGWYERQTTPQLITPEQLQPMADNFTAMFKHYIAACESTNFNDVRAKLKASNHAADLESYEQWVEALKEESQRFNDRHLQYIALTAIFGVQIDAGFNDADFVASTLGLLQKIAADAKEHQFEDLLPAIREKIETLEALQSKA